MVVESVKENNEIEWNKKWRDLGSGFENKKKMKTNENKEGGEKNNKKIDKRILEIVFKKK